MENVEIRRESMPGKKTFAHHYLFTTAHNIPPISVAFCRILVQGPPSGTFVGCTFIRKSVQSLLYVFLVGALGCSLTFLSLTLAPKLSKIRSILALFTPTKIYLNLRLPPAGEMQRDRITWVF